MKRLLAALVIATTASVAFAAPSGANAATPKPLHWNVTLSSFGPFHIGENLRDVAKTSHLDYAKDIAAKYKSLHAARGRTSGYCFDGVGQTKILLLKNSVNREQIKAVVKEACTTFKDNAISYKGFVKKYHPYTTGAKIVSFESYLREDEGSGPVPVIPSYGPYMPHAKSIYIDYKNSTYAKLRRVFKGYRFDTHLMTTTKTTADSGFKGATIHNGPVGVHKKHSKAEIWFYFNRDEVEEIQQTTKMNRPYWEG